MRSVAALPIWIVPSATPDPVPVQPRVDARGVDASGVGTLERHALHLQLSGRVARNPVDPDEGEHVTRVAPGRGSAGVEEGPLKACRDVRARVGGTILRAGLRPLTFALIAVIRFGLVKFRVLAVN